MSKKNLIIIISCVAGLLLIGGIILAIILSGAGSDSPTKLDTPVVTLQDDVASWSANPAADRFEISIDGYLSEVENILTSKKLTDGQTFKIRAIGDGVNYLDSDWSNSVTYVKAIPTYTITWKKGETILETDAEVEEGTTPTYDGTEPTKDADAQYSYVFAGWAPEVVAADGDATYSAVFTPVIRTYTVTWKNGDVVLRIDENVEYGTTPAYDEENPKKEPDTQYLYEFSGWSPVISEVVGDVTYVAQFTAKPNVFTVVWMNGDEELEADINVPYGFTPSYDSSTPTKESTPQFTYTFSGWSPRISPVTDNVTYQAQFTETPRSYTVTFYSEDGSTVLDTATVEYGSNAEYSKSTPVKNPTEAYTYVFEKWVTEPSGEVTDDLSNVTGDRAVYASFKSFIRKVTVYIVSNNPDYGTISTSVLNNVPYGSAIIVSGNTISINGETVTAQANTATTKYTYLFANWSTDATVGHDTIITANFEQSVNQFTVTWTNGDEVLEVDDNVDFGAMPVYNGAIPTKDADAEYIYTFSGWSPTVSAVTGDITYVAQFSKEDNTYTVTFYDEDGTTILGVAVVKYDTAATYPNATPVKKPTVEIAYAFDKWVTSVNGSEEADLTHITSNVDVYAKYTSETRKYTVTFCDWNGSVLDEQSIAYGQAATAPEDPYRVDYRFDGWDASFDNIVADTRITATYVRQYLVMFVDYDYSTIDIQFIDHGTDAIQPNNPVRYNHVFTGWDAAFTNVVSDLTIKAQYIRQYTVTFVDYDGTILSTAIVNSGSNAAPPSAPSNRVGYTFVSWDHSYNNITSDTEIVAVYEINQYTVKFVNPDGSIIETVSCVEHGTTISPPEPVGVRFNWSTAKGYRFTGWMGWDSTQPIVGDMIIIAEYVEEITEPIIAIKSQEIAKGATSVEISVYLCGTLKNIYGISLKVGYAEQLVISNGTSPLDMAETTVHADEKQFDLSWANGQGMNVSGSMAMLTLTFIIDQLVASGEYLVELLTDTYIIDENLSKITPVVVVGHVIITE